MAESNLKGIPIEERSVLIGDMIIINGYCVNKILLKQRFSEGGYQCQETDHFLLFTRTKTPSIIIVHWFTPDRIDADIKHHIMRELKPIGVLSQPQHFGEIIAGIVGSYFPRDVRKAWRFFGANTLQRLLIFLSTVSTPPPPDYTTIGSFAVQYQRVCELCVGETLLDAGCESGFLPLLIAERLPFMKQVMGVDIRPDMFTIAGQLANERHLNNVTFAQADLLTNDLSTIGQFDTVTALHVLEHFSEVNMYDVLANLLSVTRYRLILIVPYEEEKEVIYEHQQVFTRSKLEDIGVWCLKQLKGEGRMWYEDCIGGLLLIERRPHI